MNQAILDWQNSLNQFGITYNGPKNGEINPEFVSAMINLERKYKAYGEIFTGQNIKMPANEAAQKFLKKPQEDKKNQPAPKEEIKFDQTSWENFFKSNIPIFGSVFSGDLKSSAKKLEDLITKKIGRSASGIIWNQEKNIPATTIDDVKRALELLQKNQSENAEKQAKTSMDNRIYAFSKIILEK